MLLVNFPVCSTSSEAHREGSSIRLRLLSLIKDEVCYAAGIVGIALAAAGHTWADPAASLLIGAAMSIGAASAGPRLCSAAQEPSCPTLYRWLTPSSSTPRVSCVRPIISAVGTLFARTA